MDCEDDYEEYEVENVDQHVDEDDDDEVDADDPDYVDPREHIKMEKQDDDSEYLCDMCDRVFKTAAVSN